MCVYTLPVPGYLISCTESFVQLIPVYSFPCGVHGVYVPLFSDVSVYLKICFSSDAFVNADYCCLVLFLSLCFNALSVQVCRCILAFEC